MATRAKKSHSLKKNLTLTFQMQIIDSRTVKVIPPKESTVFAKNQTALVLHEVIIYGGISPEPPEAGAVTGYVVWPLPNLPP